MSSPIVGFTILRNGIKYDYPYLESISSLLGLCENVYLALGESIDGTEGTLNHYDRLIVKPTKWDESKRKGGEVLSEQTNIALSELRMKNKKGWAIYLQSDEVFSELEYDTVRSDLKKAEQSGCDAVSFRYLHFWLSANQLAIGKRWYPQEVRAIRIDSDIQSFGDAQGFKGVKKVYQSDAHVFHYGHVREKNAYEEKKNDFHKLWHEDSKLKKVIERSKLSDQKEETLNYFGNHPSVMQKRIQHYGDVYSMEKVDEVWIYCEKDYPLKENDFIKKIRAQKIHFIHSWFDLYHCKEENTVLFKKLTLTQRILLMNRNKSRVLDSMRSPQARSWEEYFLFILRLSEKRVGFGV